MFCCAAVRQLTYLAGSKRRLRHTSSLLNRHASDTDRLPLSQSFSLHPIIYRFMPENDMQRTCWKLKYLDGGTASWRFNVREENAHFCTLRHYFDCRLCCMAIYRMCMCLLVCNFQHPPPLIRRRAGHQRCGALHH